MKVLNEGEAKVCQTAAVKVEMPFKLENASHGAKVSVKG